MNREEMIRLLVISGHEGGGSLWSHVWLEKILEFGFRGYANMSDAELAAEIRARRLDCPVDSPEEYEGSRISDDQDDVAMLVPGRDGTAGEQ